MARGAVVTNREIAWLLGGLTFNALIATEFGGAAAAILAGIVGVIYVTGLAVDRIGDVEIATVEERRREREALLGSRCRACKVGLNLGGVLACDCGSGFCLDCCACLSAEAFRADADATQ